jgi:hypothetical protein
VNIKSMVLISATALVLSACGSGSPQTVTLNYMNDMGSGEFLKAENLSKGAAKAAANQSEKEDHMLLKTPATFKIVKSEINGSRAKIHALANNGHHITATLVKTDGNWYVTSLRKGN